LTEEEKLLIVQTVEQIITNRYPDLRSMHDLRAAAAEFAAANAYGKGKAMVAILEKAGFMPDRITHMRDVGRRLAAMFDKTMASAFMMRV
jgi:hypothetical protein